MHQEQLARAGFLLAEWVPDDTRYRRGALYVRMTERGSLRLFVPDDAGEVELASGNLYEPLIHYVGPLAGVAAAVEVLLGQVL